MAKFQFSTESNGDVTVVYLQSPRLDESHAGELAYELNKTAEKEFQPKILINMKDVTYISSAIIGKLAAFQKKMNQDKGTLKFCSVSSAVMKVFQVTRMDKIFTIYGDAVGAMNAFRAGKGK
ncbi:MAG: STAS domain-containing protein [Planctomycetes bacterium]|nr:STAS domain-containing protein [Planctomycetota bacterium]